MVLKVLHVVFKMGRGGVETWLMNVLRRIDRRKYRVDFMVQTDEKHSYNDEILSLGSRLFHIRPGKLRPTYFLFLHDFKRLLKEYGPYDVVHMHNTVRYGTLMREAAKAGVPVRIIHSHSMQSRDDRLATWPLCFIGRYLMHKYATAGLGCSREACAAMFGKNWSQDPRYRPLYYGLDLKPYRDQKDRLGARKELGIDQKSLVVGHVGRFSKIKNHDFILEIASQLVQKRDDVRFLLVGDGEEKARIQQRLDEMKLADYFVLTGLRADVARMLSAMDIFVLPSFSEGLGMVLLEAQATGLPCLLTHNLPTDVEVVKELCHRLPLAEGPACWANRLLELHSSCYIAPTRAFNILEKSHFNIDVSVKELIQVYEKN